MNTENLNTTNLQEARVFNLTKDLLEMQSKKKSIVKSFNEEIKRIKAEITDSVNGKENPLEKIDDTIVID